MARARNIKPGFFTNDQLVECPMATRLLFVGLWTVADREGRLADRPKKIKMEVFPADDVDVAAGLDELTRRGFLIRYTVAGEDYIQVVNWHNHQKPHVREAQSTIPGPPEAAPTPPPDAPKAQPRPVPNTTKVVPDHSQDARIPDSGLRIADSLIADSGLPLPGKQPREPAKVRRRSALLERSEEEAQVLAILAKVDGFPADQGDDTTERLRELAADFEGVNLLGVAKELRMKPNGVKNGWLTYRNFLDAKRKRLAERPPPVQAIPTNGRAPGRSAGELTGSLTYLKQRQGAS